MILSHERCIEHDSFRKQETEKEHFDFPKTANKYFCYDIAELIGKTLVLLQDLIKFDACQT